MLKWNILRFLLLKTRSITLGRVGLSSEGPHRLLPSFTEFLLDTLFQTFQVPVLNVEIDIRRTIFYGFLFKKKNNVPFRWTELRVGRHQLLPSFTEIVPSFGGKWATFSAFGGGLPGFAWNTPRCYRVVTRIRWTVTMRETPNKKSPKKINENQRRNLQSCHSSR